MGRFVDGLVGRVHISAERLAQRPDPTRPPGTDLLPQIRHVVVLMMENHSFDNYFGMLGRGEGFTLGDDGQPTNANPTVDGAPVRANRLPSTVQHRHTPSQSWDASHEQWAEGANDGFVRSLQAGASYGVDDDPGLAMGYWTGEDLPFYWALAQTFPLADHWFSSCLGPTFPNRRFLISGTAAGLTTDDLGHVILTQPPNGTIFDMLSHYRIPWANYHSYRPFNLWRPRRLRFNTEVRSRMMLTGDLYPFSYLRNIWKVRHTDVFRRKALAGELPAFSIVDPNFEENSEENPQDVRRGEQFAADMIEAVMRGRGWRDTALIWLYDEHGGYYDHVPPPEAVDPDVEPGRTPPAGQPRFDRYGFRVPAVVVSPWAKRDHVSSLVYDHTSVLRFLARKWNLPPFTARDHDANDMLDFFDFSAPAFADPPDLPMPALGRRR